MSESTSDALIVMAKVPVAGKVKSRLSPPLTPEEACALQHAFLLDTLEKGSMLFDRKSLFLAYTPKADTAHLPPQVYQWAHSFPQVRGDLGKRMAACFAQGFALGFRKILLIGSDIPTLPPAHLSEALVRLDVVDCVLGPSEDGGYTLIGFNQRAHPIFSGVAWGGPRVFAQTLDLIKQAGISHALLPLWYDVDDEVDLCRLSAELASKSSDPAFPTRTHACLKRIGRLI